MELKEIFMKFKAGFTSEREQNANVACENKVII